MAQQTSLTSLTMLYSHHRDSIIPSYITGNPLFHTVLIPPNKYFESHLFTLDYQKIQTSHIGHVAYSYLKKIPAFDFEKLLSSYPEKDVIALMPSSHDMYAFANQWHPGFEQIWSRLVELLGYGDYKTYGVPNAFYCNYWIMTKEWFEKYRNIAMKAMKLLETDEILVDLVNKDSNYKGTHECLPPNKLLEICQRPYYTFHPFILERLVCFIVMVEKANVHIITKEDVTSTPQTTYIPVHKIDYLKRTKSDKTYLL